MISVIIPTLNRQELLKKSIKAILDNSFLVDEILILEQWNIEKTKDVLLVFNSILKIKNIKLEILFFQEKSASKARNYWVSKALWDIIYFIDDDLEINKNYIKIAYDFLKNNKDVKIVSWKDKNAKIPKNSFLKQLIRVLTYQDIFWNKRVVLKNAQNIVRFNFNKPTISQWASGTMVIKKEVFNNFSFPKGFLRWSYSEDVYFSYQVYKKYWEWSIYFLPNLIFNHIKSDINRIQNDEVFKMMILYRFILWIDLIYNNSFLNFLAYVYWEFFRFIFIIKNSKNKKQVSKLIFNTCKFLLKKENRNLEKINEFIFN